MPRKSVDFLDPEIQEISWFQNLRISKMETEDLLKIILWIIIGAIVILGVKTLLQSFGII